MSNIVNNNNEDVAIWLELLKILIYELLDKGCTFSVSTTIKGTEN